MAVQSRREKGVLPVFDPSTSWDPPSKGRLRTTLLAARRALSAQELAQAAAGLDTGLRDLIHHLRTVYPEPVTVCAYVPIGAEPGGQWLPHRLIELVAPGRVLLPVLLADLDLDWALYTDPQSLAAADRGLSEPTGVRLGVDVVSDAQLVLVPALAVDRDGVRLGRGGGSYDRALARVGPSTLVVALLHEGELLDRIPGEVHDQRVDAVLTPAGLTRLRV
jgi:5-formyltetrahydrofolate cyclo-ligase